MVSSFSELQVTLTEYPIDIFTMSETWLKNNPHLLSYVAIPGYNNEFRNRDEIRGGGVGAYIREDIKYKRRQDIENIEHQLEVPGRNRHSKLLLGVVYRSERMMDYSQSKLLKKSNSKRNTLLHPPSCLFCAFVCPYAYVLCSH